MLHLYNIFAVVLTTQILNVLFVVPNIYQNLHLVMCIFSNMSTNNISLKDHYYFRLKAEDRESGTFSDLAVIVAFCKCAIGEKRVR